MDLGTAQSAVNALKTEQGLAAAYHSYSSGHDGKHRSASVAYSHNFASGTGNEAAGYYQVGKLKEDFRGKIQKQVWVPMLMRNVTKTYTLEYQDLSAEDEKRLLVAAFKQDNVLYLQHPVSERFCFGAFIPAGFTGHVFRGGGKVYPKIADRTNVMMIVVQAGGGNPQIVTHMPEMMDIIVAMTKLT